MSRHLFFPIAGMLLLASCVAALGPHGAQLAIAPPLPAVVELVSPYYAHAGYHYYYLDQRWYYAPARGERWIVLPRDHYPREVRFRGQGRERYRGEEHHRGHRDDRYREGDRDR